MITFSRLGRYGQLGNQMFQYATLKAISLKRGHVLKLPRVGGQVKARDLIETEHFEFFDKVPELTATDKVRQVYKEASHYYDPKVFSQPDGTDFEGYFQTEKYFKDVEKEIRADLRFKSPIDDYAREYVAGIRGFGKRRAVVAIHVRRGDNLQHPHLHRVLPIKYFETAIAKFAKGTTFLVFSDGQEWCAENFQGRQFRFVGTPSHWHDLAVMTYCDHFIISGSSFSWWGAWLGQAFDKEVYAPWPWFGKDLKLDTWDILPTSWNRIEVPHDGST